jgi:CheY-specific phosphatase CheX
MTVDNLARHLRPACEEVLETMFFTSVMEGADAAAESSEDREPRIDARLTFAGEPSGVFQVRTTASAARALAAGFLGEREADVTSERAGEVVCELANMLCGSVLSRMDAAAVFELSHPELAGKWPDAARAGCRFELPEGPLEVAVELDS